MSKTFKCTFCPYTSMRSDSVTIHMRTHTGEKPYKCGQCSYACSRQDALKLHTRTHTSEERFKCSMCSYAATNSRYLQVHMRIHTGEKPYKCNMCSYAAARTDTLKNHMRTHSGESLNGSAKRTNSKARNNDIESAASSGTVVSTKAPPTRLSFSDCLIPSTKILQETSHDLIEISDMSPVGKIIVNDNPPIIDLDSDEEQAYESHETKLGACSEDNQVTKPGENETYFTEDGHFDFDHGEGHDNGISKERREIRDEDTCAIQ